MNINTSRGLIGFVAAPVTAAGLVAGALGIRGCRPCQRHTRRQCARVRDDAVAGVRCAAEGVHGAAVKPIDLQMQQEAAQPDSPAKQEASELKGDIKAEEVKEVALNTVESLANVQTPEPKSHEYKLKNPIHKHLGMMKAGFSQVAR